MKCYTQQGRCYRCMGDPVEFKVYNIAPGIVDLVCVRCVEAGKEQDPWANREERPSKKRKKQ